MRWLKTETVQEPIEICTDEQTMLRAVYDSSPDAITVTDLKGNIIACNQATLDLHGYSSKEEVIGKNALELIAKRDRQRAIENLKKTLEEGSVKNVEYIFLTKEGHEFPAELSASLIRDPSGNPLGFVAITKDITERKKAEEELRRSREEYAAVTNLTGDIIVRVDKEGRWTFLNDSACEFWGKPREKLLGAEFADYIHPDDVEKTYAAIQEGIKTKQIMRGVINRQKTSKGWRTVEWNGVAFFDEKGNYAGFQATGRDITERIQMEEALKRSEEKFRNIFESANDCMIYLDRSGRILDVNRKALEVFGGSKEEALGKHFTKLGVFSLRKIPTLMDNFARMLAGKKASDVSICIKNKKGQKIYLECSSSLMKTHDKHGGLLVIARDVTERKKAEEALRESEAKYRNLIENARDAIVTFDLKGNVTSVNKVAAEYGLKEGEIVGKNMLKFVPKKYWPKLLKDLAMIARGKLTEGEIEVITPKGKKVVEYRSNPLRQGNKIVGLQTIIRDITERKWAEQAIRESQQKFERLFMNNPEAADYLDPNFRILDVNPRFQELFGYSLDEVRGKHINDVIVPKHLRKEAEMLDREAKKGYAYHDTVRKRKDGTLVPVSISAAPIIVEGRLVGTVGIYRDITERKQMEKKLEEYSQHLEELVEKRTRQLKEAQEQLLKAERLAALGEVAAMVGHDLRNPLQSIENATYYLKNELQHTPLPTPNRKKIMGMLKVLNDSVNYADRIIADLRDFSTTRKPTLKRADINTIVKEALSQIRLPENVELITEMSSLPELKVDRDMLKRVFFNLALNGVQALKEKGGTLKVSTRRTKGFVEVSFRDSGVGIPKQNMEKIFTPFFTTKARGIGMGLPICKKFVEAHGGSIQVESKEGEGSTFTVKLPLSKSKRR